MRGTHDHEQGACRRVPRGGCGKTVLGMPAQEVGSTWIYGVAADPRKNNWYRAAARTRRQFLAQHPALASDARFKEFSRLLLKVPVRT